MRKEIICYVATNEDDTEVSVQRVSDDPDYVLLKLGGFAVAIDRKELFDALETVSLYGQVFDEEKNRVLNAGNLEASRKAAAQKQMELNALAPGLKKKKKAVPKEDEGALILEAQNRTEPTESELKLAAMMSGLGSFK